MINIKTNSIIFDMFYKDNNIIDNYIIVNKTTAIFRNIYIVWNYNGI